MSTEDTLQTADPFDLDRFLIAQERDYSTALTEIRNGKKESHWIWYIFPQFSGLGSSEYAKCYSIKSIEEARQYLKHPILGGRLQECTAALLKVDGRSAYQIFGDIDQKKVKSCMTLFAYVSNPESIFTQVLVRYYHGGRDEYTLQLMENRRSL
jgi:uncharacterized protein (DUF1810 family)